MAEAAVAEATDTKAEATEATKGGLENQSAADPVADVQTEEKATPAAIAPSLLEAIKTGDTADFDARVKEEARKLLQTDKATKRSASLKSDLANKFTATVQKLVGQLGEDAEQPVWNALNALHLDVADSAVAPVREEYEEWLEDFIPEADREAYHAEVAGKSTEAKFKAAAEYLVQDTKAIKAMSLEDFAKHSTKGRNDLKAALEAAKQAGYTEGLDAPAGDATADGEKRTPSTPSKYTDLATLARAYNNREIDNATYAAERKRLTTV